MEIYIFHNIIITGLIRIQDIIHYTFPQWCNISITYIGTICVAFLYHQYVAPKISSIEQKALSKL